MKTIITTLAIILCTLATAQTPPPCQSEKCTKEQRAQWRKEHDQRKLQFIINKMNLTEAQKTTFTKMYTTFTKKMKASKHNMRHARKSTQIENPSYELIIDILQKEDNTQHQLKTNFHTELKKHFTAEQIYKFYDAEEQFNRLLMKEIDKKQRHKLKKAPLQQP